MHADHIRWILRQPADQLVLVGDVDRLEARVTFMVAVVVGDGAAGRVLRRQRPNEIDVLVAGLLQPRPEDAAPADDLRD